MYTLKKLFLSISSDELSEKAAALTYFILFSLAPFLIIIIVITQVFTHNAHTQIQLIHFISERVGKESAQTIQKMLNHSNTLSSNWIAAVVGIASIIAGGLGFISHVRNSLCKIWNIKQKKPSGIGGILFNFVISIGVILLISFLISIVFYVSFIFRTAFLQYIFSFFIISLFFLILYKSIPNVSVSFFNLYKGSLFTSALVFVGQLAIGLYIQYAGFTSIYGSTGTILVLLVWLYYSAFIFLIGAEWIKIRYQK